MSHRSRRFALMLPALSTRAAAPSLPWLAPLLALVLSLLVGGASASAQTGREAGRDITQRIRTSEDPGAFSSEIQGFIDAQVQRLLSEEPQAIGQARDALVLPVADPQSSGAFREFYAQTLASRLERAAGQNPRMLSRLNIAIVVEKVARHTRSVRFLPLAARLAGDENAAVALWGVKAGYWVLPESFESGAAQRNNFVPAVVAAVQRFPESGPMAAEAYITLSLRVAVPANPPSTRAVRAGVPVVVPAIHEIMELRISRYQPERPPQDPLAETAALVFLPHPAVWPVQSQQQQLQSLALKRNLMNQLVRSAGRIEGNPRRELLTMLMRVGSSLLAVAGPGQSPLAQAAQELSRISPVTTQEQLERIAQSVSNELQRAYPDIPPPRTGADEQARAVAVPPSAGDR